MTPIDIINAVRAHYGKTTTHTVRRLDEILAEKTDNVRNFKTHAPKMQNDFSIGTASGIMDEIMRTKLLRTSILGHHVMDKLIEGYDHIIRSSCNKPSLVCATISTRTCLTQSRERQIRKHTAYQSNTEANLRATSCRP